MASKDSEGQTPSPQRSPFKQLGVHQIIFGGIALAALLAALAQRGGPAPSGLLSAPGVYFMIAGTGFVVTLGAYLLLPGVAARQDRQLAAMLARPLGDRLKRFRRMALIVLAVFLLGEIPLAIVLWPFPDWRPLAVVVLGGTILGLLGLVIGMAQEAKGRGP